MDGRRLRQLRQNKKLTMKELGEKFNLAESTISGYELGHRKPDTEMLRKLADFFEVTSDYLLGRDYQPSNDSNPLRVEENLFFFDKDNMTEEDLDSALEYIDFLKEKRKKQLKKRNKNN